MQPESLLQIRWALISHLWKALPSLIVWFVMKFSLFGLLFSFVVLY